MVKGMARRKEHNQDTGSPETGEPVLLAVGKIRRPHGVLGEMIMDILTDFPERLKVGKEVIVGESHEKFKLRSIRPHNRGALIAFEGFMDCDAVGSFRNKMVYVPAEEIPALPAGEYYFHDLLGLAVVDEDGERIGTLAEILETGANDVYIIKTDAGEEVLLPAIEDVILNVDLDKKVMQVRLQDWS